MIEMFLRARPNKSHKLDYNIHVLTSLTFQNKNITYHNKPIPYNYNLQHPSNFVCC